MKCLAFLKVLGKMLIAALEFLVFTTILTVLVFVWLSTSPAVVPQYAPAWMASAMLKASPLFNFSERVAQLLDGAIGPLASDLHNKLAQAPCSYWIASTVLIVFLVLQALRVATRAVRRCMRGGVRPTIATMSAAEDHLPADGSGTEPEIKSPDATSPLVENKVVNIPTAVVAEEKKDQKKGTQKRNESPAPRAVMAVVQTNTEDVPSLHQKQSGLGEETKGAKKRFESPAPRAAKPTGMQMRHEAVPASAQSPSRKQELQMLRQRGKVNQHLQGVWNQGGSAWPANNGWQGGAWQGGAWQGNAWAGHRSGNQWGRNGW